MLNYQTAFFYQLFQAFNVFLSSESYLHLTIFNKKYLLNYYHICISCCPNVLVVALFLYEGVIEPTALYGAETWGMRSAERRKVSVLEMKCLRSLVVVTNG